MANMKNAINQGILILDSLFLNNNAERSESGIIHKALANLTVVATSKASAPYLLAAPTTELVS